MNRREFVRSIGAFGVASAFGGCRSPFGRGYEVVVFGDTHYDVEPADVYHAHCIERPEWMMYEFARNGEMWRTRCPRLLARAAANVTDATVFALQAGDLIQGDCDDEASHARMLDDTMNRFKRALGGLPIVTTTGNHDIRGKGAAKAYDGYMPARLSRELGRKVEGVNFMFAQGDDAWIVVDFNRLDAAKVDRLLDEAVSSRRLFFVSHGPVIPSDHAGARWMFCGGADAKTAELRRHFRRRLAERHAIVLAGHVHTQELAEWHGDGGRIMQVIVNSVWSRPELAVATVVSEGAENYGELEQRRLQKDTKSSAATNLELLEEYRPGLTRYFREQTAGSYVLSVSDDGVVLACYGGDSPVARNIRLM